MFKYWHVTLAEHMETAKNEVKLLVYSINSTGIELWTRYQKQFFILGQQQEAVSFFTYDQQKIRQKRYRFYRKTFFIARRHDRISERTSERVVIQTGTEN